MEKNNKIIAIVGPTGAGKTKSAISFASFVNEHGEKFDGYKSAEIICCDSRQIYLDMDIVTVSKKTREFLNNAEKEKNIREIYFKLHTSMQFLEHLEE